MDWDFDGDEDYADGILEGLYWGLWGWPLLAFMLGWAVFAVGRVYFGWW